MCTCMCACVFMVVVVEGGGSSLDTGHDHDDVYLGLVLVHTWVTMPAMNTRDDLW